MKRLFLLFFVVVIILTVLRLPAGLMDTLVSTQSQGKLRIVETSGGLWSGSGVLAISDANRRLNSVRSIEWDIKLGSAQGFGLNLKIKEHGRLQIHLVLMPNRIVLEQLKAELPVNILLTLVDHPVAHAGWSGSLALDSDGLWCDWKRNCEGSVQGRWLNAGQSIVPDRALGTYQFKLLALGTTLDLGVTTLDGDIRIEGNGQISTSGTYKFKATVEGDPEIVGRIPNIMDQNAKSSGVPGRIIVTLP